MGRFVTPDWAAKATAVPYAEFADPQSLNLYSYLRNIPTTRYDADGHVAGVDDAAIGLMVVATFAVIAIDIYVTQPDNARNLSNAMSGAADRIAGWFHKSDNKAAPAPKPNPAPGTQTKADSNPVVHEINPAKNPESAGHVTDAQTAGHPKVVTVGSRADKASRRQGALKGTPPVAGKDRDEYPPAWSAEGGAGASVKPIDPSDNRSVGGSMGQTIRDLPEGTKVEIKVKDQKQ